MTKGFTSEGKTLETSVKGKEKERLNVQDDNKQGLYDYDDVLHVNKKNSETGYDTEKTEFGEEEKVVDANILLARAITQLSKSLKTKDKSTGRESKVVDFSKFYEGDQDPIR